jgi:PIN domain nuclease of toxin-antitoxin system
VIVLDTHVWVWWVNGDGRLTETQRAAIEQAGDLGVSAISCWEVAKLVELGRLALDRPVLDWLWAALAYPGVGLLPLSPEVAVGSTTLPGTFHRDPADQIIVATARAHGCRVATSDRKILAYDHVETVA